VDEIHVAMDQLAERCLAAVAGVGANKELVVFLHHLQMIHRRRRKSDTVWQHLSPIRIEPARDRGNERGKRRILG